MKTIGTVPRPQGTTREAVFMQWVWDTINALRLIDTPGAATLRTTRGFCVLPVPQRDTQGKAAPPLQLTRFKIAALSNLDIFSAYAETATGWAPGLTTIAKVDYMRPSVATQTIDGVILTYTNYLNDNTRTASDGANVETQVAYPRYASYTTDPVFGIVYAIQSNFTGIVGVTWLEVRPSRVWARRYIQ